MAGKNTKTDAKKNQNQTPKSEKYYLAGTVTTALYGKRQFANGKSDKEDKYRLSLKCTKKAIEGLKEAAEPFYVDVEDKWLPEWLTEETNEDGGYINLSSSYPFPVGEYASGEIQNRGMIQEFLTENGGNINGSEVVALVSIKPGAVYPQAILIKKLKKQTIADMFAGADGFMDIPSELEEELPFA